MTRPDRPDCGYHPATPAAGGYMTQPVSRIHDTLSSRWSDSDDIVRPELRNEVMLAGRRTPDAHKNSSTNDNHWAQAGWE